MQREQHRGDRPTQGGVLRVGAPGVPGFDATLSPAAAQWEPALGGHLFDADDALHLRPARNSPRVRPLGVPALLCGVPLGHHACANAEGAPPVR
jgi:hypothetical protein